MPRAPQGFTKRRRGSEGRTRTPRTSASAGDPRIHRKKGRREAGHEHRSGPPGRRWRARLRDLGAHHLAALARIAEREVAVRHRRHLDVHVDAVHQRARQLGPSVPYFEWKILNCPARGPPRPPSLPAMVAMANRTKWAPSASGSFERRSWRWQGSGPGRSGCCHPSTYIGLGSTDDPFSCTRTRSRRSRSYQGTKRARWQRFGRSVVLESLRARDGRRGRRKSRSTGRSGQGMRYVVRQC
jgi:hypothetical protein